jgi:hypothetical protein
MSSIKEVRLAVTGDVMHKLTAFLIFIFSFVLWTTATAGGGIVVNLRIPQNPWADSHLGERLDTYMSDITRVPITRNNIDDSTYRDIGGESFQDLMARGKMQDGHFLVDIKIDRIDLERRKCTFIPMLFWRYRTYAVLTGRLRILDVSRGRMVKNRAITYEIKAVDNWQLVDDNEFDPALSIPADEISNLFSCLEDKAAANLYKEIKEISRGNNFGK